MAFREAQQAAFEADQTAIDAVHLIDQRFDAVVVELESLDQIDGLVAQLLEAAFLRVRQLVVGQGGFDRSVLQFAQLLVEVGDLLEGGQHLRLQRGFRRRQGQIAFVVEFVGENGKIAKHREQVLSAK